MIEEKTLPNYGINFCLGSYKIEVVIMLPNGNTRQICLDNDAEVIGLYHDKLFTDLQKDVENLRQMAKRIVDATDDREFDTR